MLFTRLSHLPFLKKMYGAMLFAFVASLAVMPRFQCARNVEKTPRVKGTVASLSFIPWGDYQYGCTAISLQGVQLFFIAHLIMSIWVCGY
jgi:hypothetical protein